MDIAWFHRWILCVPQCFVPCHSLTDDADSDTLLFYEARSCLSNESDFDEHMTHCVVPFKHRRAPRGTQPQGILCDFDDEQDFFISAQKQQFYFTICLTSFCDKYDRIILNCCSNWVVLRFRSGNRCYWQNITACTHTQ